MTTTTEVRDNSEAIRPLVGVSLGKLTLEKQNAFQAKIDRATQALVTQEKQLESTKKGIVAKVDALVGKALASLAAGVTTDEAAVRVAVAGLTILDKQSEELDAAIEAEKKSFAEQRKALEERIAAEQKKLDDKRADADAKIEEATAAFAKQFRGGGYDVVNLLEAVLHDEATVRDESKSLAAGKQALRELELPAAEQLSI